ncbi:hypothetical protein [Paenibacillus hamazuiensis]|uniref:hypothetical protein n=1 Tax=Paenibacillus hamazuiensis TaxID=2936508 RepID=UPI00200ECB6D|nr:hypothetical protein [Paenibacillus hamazuiensis]
MDKKPAILMVTGANLSPEAQASVQKALPVWRQTQNISYEWISGAQNLQEITGKIQTVPYDYVITVGNGLSEQALPLSAQMPDKKWVLLDDDFPGSVVQSVYGHVTYKRADPALRQNVWDDWVKQQQNLGLPIEWITETSKPIPSAWAPSEEADHIVYTDGGNPWFNQLSLQTRQHGARWIVTYTPIEGASLQRLKSLNIPVVNMAQDKLELNWDVILSGILDNIVKNSDPSGIQYYSNSEASVTKK